MFKQLVHMCVQEGHLNIINENLKKVNIISRKWKMETQQRKDLYQLCADELFKFKDLYIFSQFNFYSDGAYNIYRSLMELYEEKQEKEIKKESV